MKSNFQQQFDGTNMCALKPGNVGIFRRNLIQLQLVLVTIQLSFLKAKFYYTDGPINGIQKGGIPVVDKSVLVR